MAAIPHNPFKDFRTRQGISQYELARRIGISKHAVLRLEQGCYDSPLPSVIDYFLAHFPNLSRTYLLNAYQDFQYHTRLSNAHLLGVIADELNPRNSESGGCPVGIHPLTYLRTIHHINPTELAKRLCIAQSTIVYFEKRSIHQHTVPAQLIKALHDAEYDERDTDALAEAYDKYRKWLSAEKKLTLVKSDVPDTPVGRPA